MMTRSSTVWLTLVLIAGVAVIYLKYEVRDQERELAATERKIEQEVEAIRVLRADWAYLTSPDRLRRLVHEHLPEMEPMPGQSRILVADLPYPGDAGVPPPEAPLAPPVPGYHPDQPGVPALVAAAEDRGG